MKNIRCSTWIISMLFLCISHLFAGEENFKISRQQVIDQIKDNIKLVQSQFSAVKELNEQQKEDLIQELKMELRYISENTLPETLSVSSPDRIPILLKSSFTTSETNKDYNKAKLKSWLLALELNFVQEKYIKPLSSETIELLRTNIKDLRAGVQKLTVEKLGQYFSEQEVARKLDQMQNQYFGRINHPLFSDLRVPLSDSQMANLISEFENRLIESIDRVPLRLARAKHVEDPELKEKLIEKIKISLLNEIVHKSFQTFKKRTRDPNIDNLSPNEICPSLYNEYKQLIKQTKEIEEQLNNQKLLRRKKWLEQVRIQDFVEGFSRRAKELEDEVLETTIHSFENNVTKQKENKPATTKENNSEINKKSSGTSDSFISDKPSIPKKENNINGKYAPMIIDPKSGLSYYIITIAILIISLPVFYMIVKRVKRGKHPS